MAHGFQLGVSAYYLPLHKMKEEVRALDEAGIDFYHIDIFDGNFVENYGMSPLDLSLIRRFTNKPIEIHLAGYHPRRFLSMFAERGADIVYIHPEADEQPAYTLSMIKSLGMRAGLALSPSVSLTSVEELLPIADDVLLMAVHPGYANQKHIPEVHRKLYKLRNLQSENGYQITVDGGMTEQLVKDMSRLNIGLILGKVLTNQPRSQYQKTLDRFREFRAVSEK